MKIHILFEHGPDGRPFGSASIRLLRPLMYPALARQVEVTSGLSYAGQKVDLVVVDRLWKPDCSLAAVGELFDRVRSAGAKLIHAVDDHFLEVTGINRQAFPAEKQEVFRYLLENADGVWVTTTSLKERLSEYNRRIFVLPHALDERLVIPRVPFKSRPDGQEKPVVIGYMGTHTHDEDLMMILPALRNICDKRPGKVEIQVIAGVQELATKEKMEDLPVRWIATEPGEEEYPLFMLWFTGQVSWDLAIAPLEDHPFNHGKSDIKFLDYSAIAVPAVFSDVPAYRHSVVHMQNGLLARNQIGSWTECLDRLIDDSELRRFLAANAYEQLLANRTLKQTSGQWLEAVQWSLREPEKAVQHHVSIVIPVKNAEPYLRETLQAIFDQDTRLVYEVILVDSGSKDRTIETGSAFPVRIIQIPPEAFNHGLTRNLGVTEAAAESEFIVFLSQDAKPENNRWLEYLIQPLLEDETVAGVFSRHLPRPGACASLVRQLTQLTQSGGGEKLVKQHPGSQAGFDSHRFFLNFFSNTSSAIRRKVWDEIPFQRVDFAEDALWADQVIQAGYSIVFEPASVVLHSHNYNLIEQFRQNVDHARGFDRSFAPQAYRSPGVWIKQFLGIPYQVYQDWKFVLSSPYFAHSSLYYKIKMMLLSIPWQIATVSGAWAGAHLENMPGWLVKNLSRQARIKSQ